METVKKYLPQSFRIIVALLFLISAVAKLYPSPHFAVTTFEMKQLLPMGFSADWAAYFSRTLIGAEFALGFLLLQPHYYRKIVLPASFALLFVFSAHLAYTVLSGDNSGSCGCFGELLPMTPLEALIKNIVAMAMLVYLYRKTAAGSDKTNFYVLTTVVFGCIMAVFMMAQMRARVTKAVVSELTELNDEPAEEEQTPENTALQTSAGTTPSDTAAQQTVAVVDEPKKKKSGFAAHYADIDKGKKLLCFFAPGCEHCKETIRQLTQLKKQDPEFPEIRILFMDEEAELIPSFFEFAGAAYTYKILDIATFWETIGGSRDTPGVFYLWNGNTVKVYDGIDGNAFKSKELKTLVRQPWSALKK